MDISVGLDVGTTAIKAGAYAPDGTVLAQSDAATDVLRDPSGLSEQDPHAIWSLTADCLRRLTRQVDATRITSVGVCAQGDGFWAVDADGAPVHNAILWTDTRRDIAEDLAALKAGGALAQVGRGCHTALWPGTSALGWRWLRAHRPKAAARVAHVFTCGDWIGLKLTGQPGTDFANATIPFLDLATRGYGAALSALDCDDLRHRLPQPQSAHTPLGRITAGAAAATGLPEGVSVSVPTIDIGAMLVGLGMAAPGEAMMVLGTTAVVNILCDLPDPVDDPVAASVLHPTSAALIRVLAPTTGAAAFDWFASLHPQTLGGQGAGEIADKLNALVQDVPVGSNGVTFLPYLNGERAPFVDPSIRAAFWGLSGATTKGELGRAVMEGAALSLRHCLEAEHGLPGHPIHLTGGGARNPVWCQIIADVIGQDVLVNPSSDLGLWGAACLGRAAQSGADPIALAQRSVPVDRYAAAPQRHAAYGPIFARYRTISTAMQRTQMDLNALERS